MPAFATSTSTGPSSASMVVKAASTAAVSVMSATCAEHTLGQVAAAVDRGDAVALGDEALRDRAADAAVRTGHQDHPWRASRRLSRRCLSRCHRSSWRSFVWWVVPTEPRVR